MSQSPADAIAPQSAQPYLENWNSLGEMISRGLSFSGRERHRCFLNTRAEKFANVSAAAGFDLIDDGRGLAVVDWDQDGDLDVWLSNRTGPRVRMMRNDAHTGNHFLAIRLQGMTCNRDAIGARVEVHLNENMPAARRIIKSLRAGEGFLSQSGKWLHFGLGSVSTVSRLVVRWPGSDENETFTDLRADTRYRIVQGTGQAVVVASRSNGVRLAATAASHAKSTDLSRTVLTQRLPLGDLSYQDFSGEMRDLVSSDSLPRLINLWASWCQPCVAELQEFAQHADDLRQLGLSVVALSTDGLQAQNVGPPRSDLSVAKGILDQLQLPFETGIASDSLIDELTALDHRVFYRQLALPIPCSFLVDSRKKLAAIYKGPVEVQQLIEDFNLLTATKQQVAMAAFPFPGRRVIKDYDPSPLGLATAYLEGGYLEDARAQVRRHLETVASVKDFDRLASVLLESLRPGVVHERAATASSSLPDDSYQDAPSNTPEQAHIRRGLEAQQQKALARGYRMLARIEHQRKAFDEQIAALNRLVRLQPDDVQAKADLALALWSQHRQPEADVLLSDTLEENETDASARVIIGQTRMKLRQIDAAVELFVHATKISPDSAEARLNLAIARQVQGKTALAIEQYRLILDEHPESREALNNLAWVYATAVDPQHRNATAAVSLARRLCQATGYEVPAYLDTLAAALAETGDFAEAIQVTQAAIKLARGRAEHELANRLAGRLSVYTSGKPFRD